MAKRKRAARSATPTRAKRMFPPQHPILEYSSARRYNREVSMLKIPGAFSAFATMDETCERVSGLLPAGRDRQGRTRVSLLKFTLLLQRQARSAFEAFFEGQAYQGWVLFRPGLESALIVGKWLDDPVNARVWENRRGDFEAYKKKYWGKRIRSTSLPRSDALQTVLSAINDDFVHANPDYVDRHVRITSAGKKAFNLWLMYFDDDVTGEAHLVAFLHLYLVTIDSLLAAFKSVFPGIDTMQSGLVQFESAFQNRVNELRRSHSSRVDVLRTLGLWA